MPNSKVNPIKAYIFMETPCFKSKSGAIGSVIDWLSPLTKAVSPVIK